MDTERCDVLIIGCGPGGSTAGRTIADHGHDVLMIDQKATIGEPVQCAEYIPKLLSQYVKVDKGCITNRIHSMRTYFPNDDLEETIAPGFTVDRAVFDRKLASRAVDSGAKIHVGTRAVERTADSVLARKGRSQIMIKPKIIIGADGPRSTVGSWIDSENSGFIVAKQYEMILSESMEATEVFFHERFHGGYAWLFPKGKYANVGIGISSDHSMDLSRLLDSFVRKLVDLNKIRPDSVVNKTSGLIPINGPLQRTVSDNSILVGDAAGLTHPITGGGIMNAIISGRVAGEIVDRALERHEIGSLNEYESEWKKVLGSHLRIALNRRKMFDKYFNSDERSSQDFDDVIRKCWIAFREYYHDD